MKQPPGTSPRVPAPGPDRHGIVARRRSDIVRPTPVDITPHENLDDGATRERILDLIIECGPITAVDLAGRLQLTPAAVRRHLGILEDDGEIQEHDGAPVGKRGRGRPSRYFVATDTGRGIEANPYSAIANAALGELADIAGPTAVEQFARNRFRDLALRCKPAVDAAGDEPLARAQALAQALTEEGFAATVRPVGTGGYALQLCQGNCPMQAVAESFPQLCDAETEVFSELLGIHVQRLATLAQGEHVCTTHVPLFIRPRPDTEGTS
ncbi:MAG: winged helix-turn-helix transcriptional regulator [Bowdeniella nasicola]|nr:winged helix-turn-helix transcriptional regulator [Bowdeniella nasicola]